MILGKTFGFILAIFMVVGAVVMAWLGQKAVSVFLVAGPLVGVIVNFIYQGRKKKEASDPTR